MTDRLMLVPADRSDVPGPLASGGLDLKIMAAGPKSHRYGGVGPVPQEPAIVSMQRPIHQTCPAPHPPAVLRPGWKLRRQKRDTQECGKVLLDQGPEQSFQGQAGALHLHRLGAGDPEQSQVTHRHPIT